jgi:hypothetical protein
MRKITFLFLSLMMMCLNTSAKITTTPLSVGGIPFTGENTWYVTLLKNSHFIVNKPLISLNDYPTVKIEYEVLSGSFSAYVQCDATKARQELGSLENGKTVDQTITFDNTKFSSMDSIYICIDGHGSPSGTLLLKKVAFIKADGTEEYLTYKKGNWGNTVDCYSGISTMGKWARMGGSAWIQPWAKGETHEYTIKLNEPVPNSKWFFIYKKPDAKSETYVRVPEGCTEFTLSLNFDYGTFLNLQSQTDANKLNIASLTRTIYAPVYKDTTTLYADENGTDMGEWFGSVAIPAEKFAKAMIYDIISVKLCNSTTTSKIGFRENTTDLTPLADNLNEVAITDTTVQFDYIIKDTTVLAKLKANGVNISGSNMAITAVNLISTDDSYDPNAIPDAIQTVRSENADVVETQIFNVAGQQKSSIVRGLNLIRQRLSNGTVRVKKVLVK